MDVGGRLRGLGLGQYEGMFRDNKIDADLLPRLTDAGLKDIGVSALGDRRWLLDAIAALVGAASSSIPRRPPKTRSAHKSRTHGLATPDYRDILRPCRLDEPRRQA